MLPHSVYEALGLKPKAPGMLASTLPTGLHPQPMLISTVHIDLLLLV